MGKTKARLPETGSAEAFIRFYGAVFRQ